MEAFLFLACLGILLGNGWSQTITPTNSQFFHPGFSFDLGSSFACAIRGNGSVSCWGDLNDVVSSAPLSGGFISVSVGTSHACAIRHDGGVECWGSLAGSTVSISSPVFLDHVSVSCGHNHCCAVTQGGRVRCFGDSGQSQLDVPSYLLPSASASSSSSTSSSSSSSSSSSGAVQIECGEGVSCALLSTGGLTCWGQQSSSVGTALSGYTNITGFSVYKQNVCVLFVGGQVQCFGAASDSISPPDNDPSFYTSIAVGQAHLCAARQINDGASAIRTEIECFGAPPANAVAPALPASSSSSLVGLVASAVRTCAIWTDGSHSCSEHDGSSPALPAPSTPDTYASISFGPLHGCGIIVATGAVRCWSNQPFDTAPEVWERQSAYASALPLIPPTDSGFESVSVGLNFACGVRMPQEEIVCWGEDSSGQATPSAGLLAKEVSCGSAHCCALTSTGALECWGSSVTTAVSPIVSLSTHDDLTCYIHDTNQVACTGSPSISAPVGSYHSVSAGAAHACAITTEDQLVCFGDNTFGQATPPANLTFTSVSCGRRHTCATTSTGEVVCFGGSSASANILPTPRFIQVSTAIARYDWTCARTAVNDIICWDTFGLATQMGGVASALLPSPRRAVKVAHDGLDAPLCGSTVSLPSLVAITHSCATFEYAMSSRQASANGLFVTYHAATGVYDVTVSGESMEITSTGTTLIATEAFILDPFQLGLLLDDGTVPGVLGFDCQEQTCFKLSASATLSFVAFTNGRPAVLVAANVILARLSHAYFAENVGAPVSSQDAHAMTGGAALLVQYGSTLDCSFCNFTDNWSEGDAVIVVTFAAATFRDCEFYSNAASATGGAIYAANSMLTLKACIFVGNSAGAGGVVAAWRSVVLMNGGVTKDNHAIRGGAFYLDQSSLFDADGYHTGNAAEEGGVFYVKEGFVSLGSTTALQNEASSSSGGRGGVVLALDSTVRFTQGLFRDNFVSRTAATTNDSIPLSADVGGGVLFYQIRASIPSSSQSLSITGSKFEDNEALVGNGGALYLLQALVHVNDASFLYNHAPVGHGGAIFAQGRSATLQSSTLEYNRASRGGCLATSASAWTVSSTSFSHNLATLGGAVYHADATRPTFETGLSYTNNTAPYASDNIVASSPRSLRFQSVPTQLQTSGQSFQPPFIVSLLDEWGQVMNSENALMLSATVPAQPLSASLILTGRTYVSFVNGLASFGGINPSLDMGLLAPWGGPYSIAFSTVYSLPDGSQRVLSITGQVTIRVCKPGEFISRDKCELCGPGRFSTANSSATCGECQPGSYSEAVMGSSACLRCQPGSYSASSAQAICVTCTIGEYTGLPGASACRKCDYGYYQPSGNSTTCQQCSTGRYANQQGRQECLACIPGSYAATNGSSICSECGKGTYQPEVAEDTCLNCPAGRAHDSLGVVECLQCGLGEFGNVTGMRVCSLCPIGSYADSLGQTSCKLCPIGSYSESLGQSACIPCSNNSVTDTIGSSHCLKCPLEAEASLSGASCTCKSGFFTMPTATGFLCERCPEGASCAASGIQFSTMISLPGYWRQDPSSTAFLKCLRRTHCPGQSSSTSTQCAAHRGGLLCAVCEPGFRLSYNDQCEACPSTGHSWTLIIFISLGLILGLVITFLVMLRTRGTRASDKRKRSAALVSSSLLDPDMEPELMKSNFVMTPEAKLQPSVTYNIKLVIGFFQIVTNMITVTSEIPWPKTYLYFMRAFSFFNFDIISWQHVSCVEDVDFFKKYVVSILVPHIGFVVGLLLVSIPFFHALLTQPAVLLYQRKADWFYRLKKGLLFWVFLITPGISSKVLSYFNCREVDGTSYLVSDFNVRCYEGQWQSHLPFTAVFVALYPVGVPVLFFTLLCLNRRDILEYADRRGKTLRFLYEAYRPECWWFEVVDIVNKIFLTGVLVFFPVKYQLQFALSWFALLMLVIFFVRPFVRLADDRMQLFCQTEIFLVLLSGLVMQEEGSDFTLAGSLNDVGMSILLIAITVTIIGVFIGHMILHIRQRYWARMKRKLRQAAMEKGGLAERLSIITGARGRGMTEHFRSASDEDNPDRETLSGRNRTRRDTQDYDLDSIFGRRGSTGLVMPGNNTPSLSAMSSSSTIELNPIHLDSDSPVMTPFRGGMRTGKSAGSPTFQRTVSFVPEEPVTLPPTPSSSILSAMQTQSQSDVPSPHSSSPASSPTSAQESHGSYQDDDQASFDLSADSSLASPSSSS